MMKIKRDKYLRERGGTAKLIKVSCMKCGELLFVYQKDGPGWLKRCYLNRIVEPEKYSKLQNNSRIKELKDMKNLVCECGSVIGSPMKHKDGRLAFRLIRGKFKRGAYKHS
jgi:hypothetical protein